MAENLRRVLKKLWTGPGPDWKRMEMDGNGWKRMETDGNGWKWTATRTGAETKDYQTDKTYD